jgi:acyl-CoA thioester hydrolase
VGIGQDEQAAGRHGARYGAPRECRNAAITREDIRRMTTDPVSTITVRVNYSQTDQMGVVYHAHYVVWLDMARTEHLRRMGMSYREFEADGYRLAVGELALRYAQPARYDDLVRVRCWVRELASRKVEFGYAIEDADTGAARATARTTMMVLDQSMQPARLPDSVRRLLTVAADPVRLAL